MSTKGGGFIIGLALGALAGAAAALLLAPESGEELRKDIGEKSDELKTQAQQQVSTLAGAGPHRAVRERQEGTAGRTGCSGQAEQTRRSAGRSRRDPGVTFSIS